MTHARARAKALSATSTTNTWLALTNVATSPHIAPIGPKPMIATVLSCTGTFIVVCTALPSGSRIAATCSGRSLGSLTTLPADTTTYSANAPSRFMPRMRAVAHAWKALLRHAGQSPQISCISALA